jgi:hypothetical protein
VKGNKTVNAVTPAKAGIADHPLMGSRALYEPENTPPGKNTGLLCRLLREEVVKPHPTEKGLFEYTKGPRNITGNVQLYLSAAENVPALDGAPLCWIRVWVKWCGGECNPQNAEAVVG